MTGIPDSASSSAGHCRDGNDEGAVRIDAPPHFKDPLLNAVIWPGYIIHYVNVVLVTNVVMPCHHTKPPGHDSQHHEKLDLMVGIHLHGGASVPVLFKYCFNYCKNPVLFFVFVFLIPMTPSPSLMY